MSERFREILALLDERSSRERFMICFTLLATVFVLWNTLLMTPTNKRREAARAEIDAKAQTVTRLQKETNELEARLKIDPNELNRQTKAKLEQDIWKMNERIVEQTADLIPPQEMAVALRELLRGRRDLELVRLESLPPQPLGGRADPNAKKGDDSEEAQVWLHTVELELEGNYLSTLRYVSAIEALPWNLLWDSLEYEVIEYPRGRVKLRVQSLSTREGWIGA